ncbi:serine/threonine-protein kinase [Nocardia rhamnosiphila]
MKTVKDTDGVVWQYDEASSPLGSGGAGVVYRGQAVDGSPVAVKVVETGQGSLAKRIHSREIEIGRKLAATTHTDHLVLHHGFAIADEMIWIVMPLAAESLKQRIERSGSTMPLAEKIDVLTQIATGLQQLAEVSVVHRDLKPDNVLLLDGRWCLTDFGVSRDLTMQTSTVTRRREGTFEYMAPEYIQGGIATPKSDLYSLGIIAYELLAGRKLFVGPEAEDFIRQHQEEIPPPLQVEVPDILARLVVRLLDKDPAGRHADARAVVEMLRTAANPPVSAAQLRLAETARRVSERETTEKAEQARLDRQLQQATDRRKQALADLDDLITRAASALKTILGEEFDYQFTPHETGATWLLQWGNYQMVVTVQFAEGLPPTSTYPLLAGIITSGRLKESTGKRFILPDTMDANLVCIVENGVGKWFRRLWGITGSDEEVLSVHKLWQFVDQEHAPGPKFLPFVSKDQPLTLDNLVEDFDTLLSRQT